MRNTPFIRASYSRPGSSTAGAQGAWKRCKPVIFKIPEASKEFQRICSPTSFFINKLEIVQYALCPNNFLPLVPIWKGPKTCHMSESEGIPSTLGGPPGEGKTLFDNACRGISWLVETCTNEAKAGIITSNLHNAFIIE